VTFQLDPDLDVPSAVRAVALAELDALQALLDSSEPVHEQVHELRKTCKRVRGLVRLTRGASEALHQRENARYRDLARTVAQHREAGAAVETWDDLLQPLLDGVVRPELLHLMRQDLVQRRDSLADDARARLVQARPVLDRARQAIADWTLPDHGFDTLSGGLRKSLKRARRRMQQAQDHPTAPLLHTWRKRVKYHRYHCSLLQPLYPGALQARRDQTKALTDLLGDHHDLQDFRELLPQLPGGPDLHRVLCGVLTQRQHELADQAVDLGAHLFAEPPDAFVQRVERWWQAG